jgi:hypothetical protein
MMPCSLLNKRSEPPSSSGSKNNPNKIKREKEKNAVFWDVTLCGSCKNRRFGGVYRLNEQGEKNQEASRSLIPVTLMREALLSSETSVLIRATWRHIPKDGILHSHRRVNLKSYIALTGWTL